MKTRVIRVPRGGDPASAARQAARVLASGGLVRFPTETVYGVAALATCDEAMARLRELKSRPSQPFSVHLARPADARRYVASAPPAAQRIMDRAWPGPVTLLVPAGGRLADRTLHSAELYHALTKDDVIGLRCPDEPTAAAMLSAVDGPVVAPSANLAGRPSPRNAADVLEALDGQIDLLIDAGSTRYGKDSTIVSFAPAGGRLAGAEWKILRKGVYDDRMIRDMTLRRILFVCTGNTCRSPLAAGLARKLLAERLGCAASALKRHGVEALSAGLAAPEGARATREAVSAGRRRGADLSRHRSRRLTADLIADADWVFCMTDSHVAQARRMAPRAADRIRRLDKRSDLEDPIGGGEHAYDAVAERVEKVLRNLLDEGTL